MKPGKKTGGELSSAPFHVRAAIALGMWAGLNQVAPRGGKAPRSLVKLTEQLIEDAATAANVARACRVCGCTDLFGCDGGCYWVAEDLCSTCVPGVSKAVAFKQIDDAHRAKRSKARRSKR